VVGLIADILNLAEVSTVAVQILRILCLDRIVLVVTHVVKGRPVPVAGLGDVGLSDEFPT
jgi:hypothetical protein